MKAHKKTVRTLCRQEKNNVDTLTNMQTYILTKTYIPGDTLDSLTNTQIFIPADIKYKHIWRPYSDVRASNSQTPD